jgi:hypothetical protein
LFIVFSTCSEADSAPENTIFRPEAAMAAQVRSEYCIKMSTRPSAHHLTLSGVSRSAISATRRSEMKKSISCICTESTP